MITHQKALVTPTAPPPNHLRKAGRVHWQAVLEMTELEPHDLPLLEMSCVWRDVYQAGLRTVKRDGMFVDGRFGTKQKHPALAVMKDASDQFRMLMRELCLNDIVADDSRPNRLRGYR